MIGHRHPPDRSRGYASRQKSRTGVQQHIAAFGKLYDVFTATPRADTVMELEALLKGYREHAYRLPAPMAAGIFFAAFEPIRPFADGNGRIGRLLHLFVLKQSGLQHAFLVPIDER